MRLRTRIACVSYGSAHARISQLPLDARGDVYSGGLGGRASAPDRRCTRLPPPIGGGARGPSGGSEYARMRRMLATGYIRSSRRR